MAIIEKLHHSHASQIIYIKKTTWENPFCINSRYSFFSVELQFVCISRKLRKRETFFSSSQTTLAQYKILSIHVHVHDVGEMLKNHPQNFSRKIFGRICATITQTCIIHILKTIQCDVEWRFAVQNACIKFFHLLFYSSIVRETLQKASHRERKVHSY